MRYFLDTEFDSALGHILSLALVREDRRTLYIIFDRKYVKDMWVRENVVPKLNAFPADVVNVLVVNAVDITANTALKQFMGDDQTPVHIVADHPADFQYLCPLMDMRYSHLAGVEVTPHWTMEVNNVDSWPNNLEGAVQHNAVWDALALREKLCFSDRLAIRKALHDKHKDTCERLARRMGGTFVERETLYGDAGDWTDKVG